MKKHLLLFFALLCLGGSRAWAEEVTVKLNDPVANPSSPYAYGTRSNSNKTFTTNAASGLAGVVLTVTGTFDGYTSETYSGHNAVKVATANTDETFTLTAPSGVTITGYSFQAECAGDYTYTITANGQAYTITKNEYTTVEVTGLNANTASFTVNGTAANWVSVGPFTVTVSYDNSGYTALSDLSNDKQYTLTCPRGSMGVTGGRLGNTVKSDVTASNFAIIQFGGDYHLYSVSDGKFISNTGAETDAPSLATKVMIETNQFFSNGKAYYYRFRYQNNYVNASVGETTGATINSWNTTDDGNEFNILPDGDFTLSSDITAALSSAYTPFEVSTDDGDKTWYYINARDKYLNYTDNKFSFLETKQFVESAQWAFIGDATNGFKILNRATNTYLAYENSTIKLSETATLWKTGLHPATNGYRLTTDGTAGNNLYCNYQANLSIITGELTYQNDFVNTSSVAGGAFNFEEVPDYTEEAQQYLAYVDQNVGSYFALSTEANTTLKEYVGKSGITADELQTIYNTWNSGVQYPTTGYYRIKSSGARTGETYITYGYCADKSKYGLVTTPAANLTSDAGTVIKFTATGSKGVYTLSVQGLNVQDETAYNMPFTATDAEAATFTFEILTPGVVGIRHNTSDANAYLHESNWSSPAGVVRWNTTEGTYSHWIVESADAASFTIPMNVVGGKSYATMYLPFDVTLPSPTASSGTVVNLVTIEGERAKLAQADYNLKVAAGTPVLLYSPYGDAKVTATIGAVTDAVSGDNALSGTYVEKTSLADNEYIFGTRSGELGFWKLGEGKKVGANKAYLVYDGADAGEVKGFALDFDFETGIEAIQNAQPVHPDSQSIIYNLAGQRVQQPARGLYIMDGKKVLMK